MRDWSRALRSASFRGARFWVDEDGPEKGRRVAVHQVSGGETPIVEDMGRLAVEYSVTAYVASDLADAEGKRLEAACSTFGPGLLVLPMDPAQPALCLGCRRSRSKDRGGYIGYDLRFVEAGGDGQATPDALPAMRQTFGAGLGAAALALAEAFS